MNDYYVALNSSLRQDDPASLESQRVLINALRKAIKNHQETGIVWRGVNLNPSETSAYVAGFRFLWPAFTSASRDRSKASAFGSWGSGQKVLFCIDLNGVGTTFSRDISDISVYPDEKEVVLYCYSGFEVLSRRQDGDELVINLRTFDTLQIE